MGDREKRKRSERHAADAWLGVEGRVQHQVAAFVEHEAERGAGKKLHSGDDTMLIRRRQLQSIAARVRLRRRADRENRQQKRRHDNVRGTAEDGIPVARSGCQAERRIRKLED